MPTKEKKQQKGQNERRKRAVSLSSSFRPSMSDEAVQAGTGRNWTAWFTALDRYGARDLEHRDIAQWLRKEHALPGWWAQCVTVNYEQARGLRERYQTARGYSVSVSKTMAASLRALYDATADAAARRQWFPKGRFEPSSQTRDKYFRGAWKDARVEIGFYAKGANKAQIALQISNLPSKAAVESNRGVWKTALARLESSLAA
jgi:hypothetical protein